MTNRSLASHHLKQYFYPLLAAIFLAAQLAGSWIPARAEQAIAAQRGQISDSRFLLSAFYSFPQDVWTQVAWETALEIDIQGFNLYRRASTDEEWVKVNDQLIAAANSGGFIPTTYTWLDTSAQQGVFYQYLLETVDLEGNTHPYGPSGSSPARQEYRLLFLPSIQHQD